GIDAQHFLPRDTTVLRPVQAALFVRPEQVAGRRDEHGVGVVRADHDAADTLRVLESHVLPRRAAIERAVHAVAPRGRLPIVRLARADPHDVRVTRRNAMSPIERSLPDWSKTGSQVTPLSRLRNTPPLAAPTKMMR